MVKRFLHRFLRVDESKAGTIRFLDRKLSELEVRAEILRQKAAVIKRDHQ